MTKLQLIFTIMEAVRGQASTEDSGKFVHPQDVAYELGMAYEKAVLDFFADPELAKNYDLDYFTKSYTKTVKEDSNSRLYIDLPAQPIGLNRAQGIRSIRPSGSDVQIVRITESEWMNLINLEAFCCSPWPFAYVDFYNKKIMLQGNRKEYRLLDTLQVKIIPKFSELANTDEINTPVGDYSLTQMVMQIMGIRNTDSTNDDGR